MKRNFNMVVLIVEWSLFQGGLKVGFYCICLRLGLVENKVPFFYHCLPFITVRILVIVLFLIIEPCLTTVYQDAPLISLV